MASFKRATESNFLELTHLLRREIPKAVGRGPAQVIALKAGATSKAASYWQSGHCLPSLAHALALAQSEPHLRRLILSILDAEEGGPDEPGNQS